LAIKSDDEYLFSKIYISGSSEKGAFSNFVDTTIDKTKELFD
jgi:hypothetical protein